MNRLFTLFFLAGILIGCDSGDNEIKSTEKNITQFKFAELSPQVDGVINTDGSIALEVPESIPLTALVPTIIVSGKATVSPASGVAQDFTNPVTYTVTAEDGSKQDYTVTVDPLFANNIYIIGYELVGAYQSSLYWKNAKVKPLIEGKAETFDIEVAGADVYVCGFVIKNNNDFIATYWKNGIAFPLGNDESIAYDMVISGDDIYVAGQMLQSSTARYWKNGTAFDLSNGYIAKAIEVVGNDVYVAGDDIVGAKVWKNGIEIPLADGENFYDVHDIHVDGDDVYVAGAYKEGIYSNKAAYLKNGEVVIVGTGVGFATTIKVVGHDVYVAGNDSDGVRPWLLPRYWKNGNAVELTDGSYDAVALSMDVHGTDVYVAGHKTINNNLVAMIWKNGVPRTLTAESKYAAVASGIVVKD